MQHLSVVMPSSLTILGAPEECPICPSWELSYNKLSLLPYSHTLESLDRHVMLPKRCWPLVCEGGYSYRPSSRSPHQGVVPTPAQDHDGRWGWAALQVTLKGPHCFSQGPRRGQKFPGSQFPHL